MSTEIKVAAYGSRNSFGRRVQQNPHLAVDLLDAVIRLHAYWDLETPLESPTTLEVVDDLNEVMTDLYQAMKRCQGERP